jgi:hypothetical protein
VLREKGRESELELFGPSCKASLHESEFTVSQLATGWRSFARDLRCGLEEGLTLAAEKKPRGSSLITPQLCMLSNQRDILQDVQRWVYVDDIRIMMKIDGG